jgi:hypothetical protein
MMYSEARGGVILGMFLAETAEIAGTDIICAADNAVSTPSAMISRRLGSCGPSYYSI